MLHTLQRPGSGLQNLPGTGHTMSAADRVVRWSTALDVLGVVVVAAVVSHGHASDLVRAHGETGWTARLIPLTVDGSSMRAR